MLRKFCRCGKIIPQTQKYCDECQSKLDKRNKILNKDIYKRYRNNRTDIKEQRFYNSEEWIFTRDTIKQKYKGLCALCDSEGKISYEDNVHHIVELKEDWSKRTTMSNLIPLCKRCHYRVHKKYKKSEKDKAEMQSRLSDIVKIGGILKK